jgi:hypothetical protein
MSQIMKTVIVRGKSPVPEALREVIERGSTSVQECHVPGPTPLPRDVDRVVFFTSGDDPDIEAAARQAVRAERKDGDEKLVYVLAKEKRPAIDGLTPTEVYVWPRDEDRLKMAFMTGA